MGPKKRESSILNDVRSAYGASTLQRHFNGYAELLIARTLLAGIPSMIKAASAEMNHIPVNMVRNLRDLVVPWKSWHGFDHGGDGRGIGLCLGDAWSSAPVDRFTDANKAAFLAKYKGDINSALKACIEKYDEIFPGLIENLEKRAMWEPSTQPQPVPLKQGQLLTPEL